MSIEHSITLRCTQCQTHFERFVSNVKKGQYPFCSRVCKDTFQRIQNAFHRVFTQCAYCQTSLVLVPSRKKESGLYFCNRVCMNNYNLDIPARFWEKVAIGGGDDCWPWTAAIEPGSGYGATGYAKSLREFLPLEKVGNAIGAHRVAFFLHYGVLDPRLEVCHHCDNRPCCNPKHLFQGTQGDNVRDMVSKKRVASGVRHGSVTQPESRIKGERHHHARFTFEEVKEMQRLRYEENWSCPRIGKLFNAHYTVVWNIVTGRSRKNA